VGPREFVGFGVWDGVPRTAAMDDEAGEDRCVRSEVFFIFVMVNEQIKDPVWVKFGGKLREAVGIPT